MCICLFDDGPHDDDKYAARSNMFKVGMKDAPCKDPLMCLGGLPCGCICIANCYMRHKVLEGDMDQYMCCQGYYDGICPCWKSGSVGDQGNPACLACEGCCCASCALSSTRMYVMDKFDLMSDPCDRRIIRFNNFMQLLSCVCDILACFIPELQDAAQIIRFIADLVFYTTAGMMFAQVNYEWNERKKEGTLGGGSAPQQAYVAPPVGKVVGGDAPPAYSGTPAAAESMDR
mmetsp:Transcript_20299/g.60557  ORF Transcript_20299/g.60557 Transcript_20299/m.60557 type:complete len:231 (-) Transcript_20299:78-770(-)